MSFHDLVGFLKIFPVRVPVIWHLACESNAKPVANPRERSPHLSLVVSNLQPALRPTPSAELVSNSTPPGSNRAGCGALARFTVFAANRLFGLMCHFLNQLGACFSFCGYDF